MRLARLVPAPLRTRFAPLPPTAVKVPAIGVMFWVIKVLTTGMGEATSDWLGSLPVVLVGLVGLLFVGVFVGALVLQFRTTRYVAPIYWTVVAMIAVFGTMAADTLHAALMLPYWSTVTIYALLVALLFRSWYRSEGTLSIHSITTTRRETYYWLTVMATFALGTAAGDFSASELNLGFFSSGILFAIAIAVPAIGWAAFKLNPVIAFWSAYVLTRPLGASFADWFGKPHAGGGGLDFHDGPVAGVAALAIIALVGIVAVTRVDVQDHDETAYAPGRDDLDGVAA